MYDLIIIGGGPGGAAGAVYAARKQLKTLLITSDFGGQSVVSTDIQNWIGTTNISGQELADNLKKHVLAYANDVVTVKEGVIVTSIKKSPDQTVNIFDVTTDQNETYQAKTVLISSGSGHRRLEALGADRLEHKGLTYCASCDGPLFTDMDVAVIGGGNSAFETAAQLLAYTKSVTLIHRNQNYRADPITVKKVLSHPKMHDLLNVDILEIKGDKFVDGIVYKEKNSETKELKVAGIFVEIGQIPNTAFAKDIVDLDEYNRIKIDPWTGKSSTPGIWAAGDCTNILYHQNNIATGDAVKAVEDLYLYLHAK